MLKGSWVLVIRTVLNPISINLIIIYSKKTKLNSLWQLVILLKRLLSNLHRLLKVVKCCNSKKVQLLIYRCITGNWVGLMLYIWYSNSKEVRVMIKEMRIEILHWQIRHCNHHMTSTLQQRKVLLKIMGILKCLRIKMHLVTIKLVK